MRAIATSTPTRVPTSVGAKGDSDTFGHRNSTPMVAFDFPTLANGLVRVHHRPDYSLLLLLLYKFH